MWMTTHHLALIESLGSFLTALGSLYWAYEILGGQNGPMNLLTRTVSYSLLFGIGYGIVLGPWFGIVNGIGLGVVLSLEQQRVATHQRKYGHSPLNHIPSLGAARGIILTIAAWRPYGFKFAFLFGTISAFGLYVIYKMGYAPTYDYRTHTRPVLSSRRLKAALWRGTVIGFAGFVSGILLINDHYTSTVFGLEIGLTVAIVNIFVSTFSPMIEYGADHLPDRQLATMGVVVMLFGMLMQSVQYLVVLLDIPVH